MTDAIVIGGGHNGLVAATLLARKGVSTTVLEARDEPGGLAAPYEFAPGFTAPGCALFLRQLQSEVVSSLELESFGLDARAPTLASISLGSEGATVVREHRGVFGNQLEVTDKARYADFQSHMTRLSRVLAQQGNRLPPKLGKGNWRDKAGLGQLALDIRRLGKADMRELLRVGASNIFDVLNEWFTDPQLKGLFALDAVLGSHLGPRSGNTMLTFLHQLGGSWGGLAHATAGRSSWLGALSQAANAAGVDVRTNAQVEQVNVLKGGVSGVQLASGETLSSDLVVSNLDPKSTVFDLVGARHFDTGFVRRIRHVRMAGTTARLDLALNALPDVPGLEPDHYGQRLVIAPSPDHVERAFNPVKYGNWSEEAVMELSFPSVAEPECAPLGQHVLSATVQYVPFELRGGWNDAQKQALTRQLVCQLERYMPGLADLIVHRSLLTPADIAERYGNTGGHWHHGELALDQYLFVRPTYGAAQYALPVRGLYLCGAGAHPGGGLTGSPGRNCAVEMIRREGL